jgi:hypothetical protein
MEISNIHAPDVPALMAGTFFQVVTTPSGSGNVRFQIVIDGSQILGYEGKRIKETTRLYRVIGPRFTLSPGFEAYPGAPKINISQKSDVVTITFTAPQKVADDPAFALYFKGKCTDGCPGYYARLAFFKSPGPSAPAAPADVRPTR